MYGEHCQNAESHQTNLIPLKILLVLFMIVMIMGMVAAVMLGGVMILNPYAAAIIAIVCGALGWASSVYIDKL